MPITVTFMSNLAAQACVVKYRIILYSKTETILLQKAVHVFRSNVLCNRNENLNFCTRLSPLVSIRIWDVLVFRTLLCEYMVRYRTSTKLCCFNQLFHCEHTVKGSVLPDGRTLHGEETDYFVNVFTAVCDMLYQEVNIVQNSNVSGSPT